MNLFKYLTVFVLFINQMAGVGSSLQAQTSADRMTLDQILDGALKKNPSIQAAQWRKLAAEKRIWEARSGFFPRINVIGSYTRYKEPMIITPIHEPGKFPPLDDKIFTSQLQLQLPLFNGGRTSATYKAAKASAAESKAQGESVETKVIQNVAGIYLQAKEVTDKRHLIAQRLNALRQRYRELSLLQREGRVSEADFALMNSSLQSTLADSLELESAWYQLGIQLGQIIGVGHPIIPDVSDLSGSETTIIEADLLPDTTNIEERSHSPEIKKARAQLMQAKAMKSLATRSFLPEVSGFYVQNTNSGGSEWNPVSEWAVGLTVRIPLFDGGRRIASVGAAGAAEKAAAANLTNTLLEKKALLEMAFLKWQTTFKQRQFLTQAVESKQKYVEAQQKLYKEGRISLSELLTQETELLTLQIQEKELRYTEQRAIIDYHTLIGDLTAENVKKILQ
ncbi:MAG: hypothetical protein Kow0042_01480 [Calditrichia bacterium]